MKKILSLIAAAMLAGSLFAGCTGGDVAPSSEAAPAATSAATAATEAATEAAPAEGGKFQSRTINYLSIWDDTDPTENTYMLIDLSNQYAETVEGFELVHEYVGIDSLDERISILTSSDDLPEVFVYESGTRLKTLIDSGQILDMDKTLTDLGIRDCVDAGAASLLTALVDGKGLYDLPLGMNMEGFWYNKALFEQAGVTAVPTTWDEFMAVCQQLKDAGIIPIVQGGADQWPMTRVLNAYLLRSTDLNAVTDAMKGTRKFTDPEFVAAAQMFQDMATNGYFAEGMSTIDPATASSMLMGGQAAMKYDGSWFSGDLNSPDNPAGPEGIGFFNVPVVNENSTITDYSMNCGNILAFSAKKYDEAVGDWMKFVFPKIGDYAMTNNGSFKGFKINNMPADMTYYTQIVADALAEATGSFLWFEANMDAETSTIATANIALLYSGEMTAEDYMAQIQESADRNRAA